MKKVWVIMADQLSYKFVGYNRFHNWIKTPAIDWFARKSTVFTQAYCSSPLCIPSRQSLYTGRNTRHHGCICDYRVLSKPTMFQHLSEMGVKSYGVGKLDFRFDDDQNHGLSDRPNSELGAQDVFPGTNNFSSFVPGRMVTTLDRDNDEQCCLITGTTLDCLSKNESSLIFTSYMKPHESWDNGLWWDAPQRFWDIYGDIPNALRGYAANVSLLDEHIGYAVGQAMERGLLDDTLVIFASDHGELAGEHGRWGKQCMHEEAIRVPMLMFYKGMRPITCHSVVGLIDIFPTIFDWLGLPCPQTDGASLLKERPVDYHVFIEVFWGKFVDNAYCNFQHEPMSPKECASNLKRCIRRDNWKYVDNGSSKELFHVTARNSKPIASKTPRLLSRFRSEMGTCYPASNIIPQGPLHDKAFN